MASDLISSVSVGTETARLAEPPTTQHARTQAANEARSESVSGGKFLPGHPGLLNAQENSPVELAVSKLRDYVQNFQRDLKFSVDKDTGRTVIKVVDSATDEVIRQIPPEHVLRLVQRLESLDSLIFEEQA